MEKQTININAGLKINTMFMIHVVIQRQRQCVPKHVVFPLVTFVLYLQNTNRENSIIEKPFSHLVKNPYHELR